MGANAGGCLPGHRVQRPDKVRSPDILSRNCAITQAIVLQIRALDNRVVLGLDAMPKSSRRRRRPVAPAQAPSSAPAMSSVQPYSTLTGSPATPVFGAADLHLLLEIATAASPSRARSAQQQWAVVRLFAQTWIEKANESIDARGRRAIMMETGQIPAHFGRQIGEKPFSPGANPRYAALPLAGLAASLMRVTLRRPSTLTGTSPSTVARRTTRCWSP
jgi:hypothetical protein